MDRCAAIFFNKIVDAHNVWMICLAQPLSFVQKTVFARLPLVWVFCRKLPIYLYSNVTVNRIVT